MGIRNLWLRSGAQYELWDSVSPDDATPPNDIRPNDIPMSAIAPNATSPTDHHQQSERGFLNVEHFRFGVGHGFGRVQRARARGPYGGGYGMGGINPRRPNALSDQADRPNRPRNRRTNSSTSGKRNWLAIAANTPNPPRPPKPNCNS